MTSGGRAERARGDAAPPGGLLSGAPSAGDPLPAAGPGGDDLPTAMAAANIQALWDQAPGLMPARPAPRAVPWLWRWRSVLALATQAGKSVPIGRGGERRALAMANPGLGGRPFATPTLWAAMQYLNPRESAPAHRHSAAAIRFVLRGEGVWTTVEGQPCPMSRGDLVLTPSMTWHEHHSGADEPMIWFDGLDLPLVSALDAGFFETAGPDYLDTSQDLPVRAPSTALYGHPGLLPATVPGTGRHSPLLVYRWEHTARALAGAASATGRPDVEVRFTDPARGRDALATMRCTMRRLAAGHRTPATRTVGSSVIVVFSGHGTTVIDGTSFGWGPGDTLAVPSWCAVDHEAAELSEFFVLSDAPVLEALGLDRTEVLDGPQPVTGAWSGG